MQIGDFNIRYNELHPYVCYAYELLMIPTPRNIQCLQWMAEKHF